MIFKNRTVKLVKTEDTRFNNAHPNGINVGYEKTGIVYDEPVVGDSFCIHTDKGMFCTSTVKSIDGNIIHTTNSVYEIEILEDIKSARKPTPKLVYQHYKGGLYEVLHLAKYTEDDSDLVICQSLHYGSYHARPLKEWFDVMVPSADNNGQGDILRFMVYTGNN